MKRQPTRPLLLGRKSPARTSSESDLRSEGHRPTHPQQRSLHGLHPDIHEPETQAGVAGPPGHTLNTEASPGANNEKGSHARAERVQRYRGAHHFGRRTGNIRCPSLSHRKLPTCQARDVLGRVAQLMVQSGTLDPTPLFNPSASQHRTWTKLAEGTHRCERSVWVWRVSLKLAWSSAFSHTSSAAPQVDATVSLFHMSAISMKVADDLVSRKEAEIVKAQPFGSSAGSIATGFPSILAGCTGDIGSRLTLSPKT